MYNIKGGVTLVDLLFLVLGYFIGSIPFALVIGKLFYKKDIRQYGSGNLGASNAGRVLGKKAGLAVTILDASKSVISLGIAYLIQQIFHLDGLTYFAGFGAIIGHCYPIFASFKGGKAVSVSFGYVLFTNFWLFAVAGITFLLVLKITKIVSISSIIAFVAASIASIFLSKTLMETIILVVLTLFIIYRHKSNFKRLKDGTENKVTWI